MTTPISKLSVGSKFHLLAAPLSYFAVLDDAGNIQAASTAGLSLDVPGKRQFTEAAILLYDGAGLSAAHLRCEGRRTVLHEAISGLQQAAADGWWHEPGWRGTRNVPVAAWRFVVEVTRHGAEILPSNDWHHLALAKFYQKPDAAERIREVMAAIDARREEIRQKTLNTQEA
jgi:hypothetical protein